jgi:SPOR domain
MSEPILKRRPMIDLEEFERRLRKPLSLSQQENDPLAELARFGGGQDVPYGKDPYKDMFEAQARLANGAMHDRGEGRSDVKGRVQEPLIRGDFASIEAGLLGSEETLNPPAHIVLDHSEVPDEAGRLAYADDAGEANETSPPYEEMRSRRPLYVMAAMIIAGIAGIFASFAFKGAVLSPDEVATITAAEGPVKVQPESAAASEAPAQDAAVLSGQPQQPPVATVSNIEQPSDLSAQADASEPQGAARDAVAGAGGTATSVPVPPPPAQAQNNSPGQPQTIAELIEPKKVKTYTVRPDGTLVPNGAPPQPAARAPSAPDARKTLPPAAKAATPKTAARAGTTPKPPGAPANGNPQTAQSTAQPKAKHPESTPKEQGAAAPGTFAVQLAAPGSEQEARALQLRLMQKYGTELGGFQPSIRKAEVGGREVYRVRFTGAASREQAEALCQKVHSEGGSCFVAKN